MMVARLKFYRNKKKTPVHVRRNRNKYYNNKKLTSVFARIDSVRQALRLNTPAYAVEWLF